MSPEISYFRCPHQKHLENLSPEQLRNARFRYTISDFKEEAYTLCPECWDTYRLGEEKMKRPKNLIWMFKEDN